MAAAAPAAPFSSETLPDVSGKVLSGTCGWSDPTLLQCGRFYPRHLRSATAGPRLAFYSGPRGFGGTVEIDTSNYSLPSHKSVATWADSTPPGFTFHIKAFGLFASRTCQWRSLPRESREAAEKEAPWLAQRTNVKLEELPEAVVQGLWSRFNSLCELLYNRGKLGLVVFQFNRGCKPTWHNVQFITDLRRRLTPVATMAVEFRCRAWYVTDAACSYEGALRREAGMERPPSLPPGRNGVALGPGSTLGHVAAATVANLPLASRYVCRPWDEGHACLTSALATRSAEGVLSAASEWAAAPATVPPDSSPVMPNCQQVFTAAWLMALGIVHVASDDLLQEQGPAEEGHFARGTLPSTRLPVYPLVTSPAAAYVRVHRRRGQQRCLADAEVQRWALRLQAMAAQLRTLQGHLACLPTAPPVPQADAGLGVGSQSSAAEFVEPSAGYGPTPAQIRSGGMVVSVPAYANLVCGEGGQAAVGALFLMWGTDWEDQPLLNAKAVCGALPTAMVFPWQQHVKRHAKPVGISAFFQQQTSGPAAGGEPAEKARGSMPTAVAPCLVGGSEPRPRHLSPLAAAFAKSPPRGAKRDRAAAVDSACDISDGDDDGDEVELVSTAPAPAPKAKGLHAFFQASPKRKRA